MASSVFLNPGGAGTIVTVPYTIGPLEITSTALTSTVPWTVNLAALGTTSTSGGSLVNTTAATGAATVQISPRLLFRGNAWDTSASQTVDFFWENLPATAATPTGTAKLGYSLNGAAASYPMTISSAGFVTLLDGIRTAGLVEAANGQYFQFGTGRVKLASTADGLFNPLASAANFGIQFNLGTVAPTASNGTITTGSRNVAGEVTLTGGNTTSTITYGAPNWTNTPFITVTGTAATDVPHVTASSATAFTVAGITSNGKFSYHCIGRI